MKHVIIILAVLITYLPLTLNSSVPEKDYALEFYEMVKSNKRNRRIRIKASMYAEAAVSFRKFSKSYGVDPRIFFNLLRGESVRGHIYAFNRPYEARGLGQIREIVALDYWRRNKDIKGLFHKGKLNIWVLYRPRNNIKISAWLLSRLIKSYKGDVRKAIAAYNTGPGTLAKVEFAYRWADGIMERGLENVDN